MTMCPRAAYDEFTLENFKSKCLEGALRIELKNTYSFMMAVACNWIELNAHGHNAHRQAGNQIGIVLDDYGRGHDLDKITDLYNRFHINLELCENEYIGLGEVTLIKIIVILNNSLPELKIENYKEYKDKLKEISGKKFSFGNDLILPLTLDTRYYGNLLKPSDEKESEIINKLLTSKSYREYNSKLEFKLLGTEKIYKYTYKGNNKSKAHGAGRGPGNKTIYIIIQSLDNYDPAPCAYGGHNIILKHIFTPGGLHIITIKDIIMANGRNDNSFNREIHNNIISVENTAVGPKIVKLINKLKPFKPILDNGRGQDFDKIRKSRAKNENTNAIKDRNSNYGVFDIETYVDDNISKIFSLGFKVDYEDPELYYITDLTSEDKEYYKNTFYITDPSDILALKCILSMLKNEYNKYKFYAHNLGGFDVIFIFHLLLKINSLFISKGEPEPFKVDVIMRNGVIIKLSIKYPREIKDTPDLPEGQELDQPSMIQSPTGTDDLEEGTLMKTPRAIRYNTISFIDSYNILNHSLAKLAKDFKLPMSKTHYPYSFVTKDNFNYIGSVPDIKYFENISLIEYNKLINDNHAPAHGHGHNGHWDLKEVTLKYLANDLELLFEILTEFSIKLYNHYNVDMTSGLTITRLALNIFTKNFYPIKELGLIDRLEVFKFIKKGYYGGITEVYKPHGFDLKYIDINSLYPFVALNPMPGLKCEYIESFSEKGLDLNDPRAAASGGLFGFFEAEVTANGPYNSHPAGADTQPCPAQRARAAYLGLLPIHKNGSLILPHGKFTGIWCSEELKFTDEEEFKDLIEFKDKLIYAKKLL